MRYFLFDCFGDVAGNRKGYATFRGAAQAERMLRAHFRRKFDAMQDINPCNKLLSRISQKAAV
jgi:hypothetical protein